MPVVDVPQSPSKSCSRSETPARAHNFAASAASSATSAACASTDEVRVAEALAEMGLLDGVRAASRSPRPPASERASDLRGTLRATTDLGSALRGSRATHRGSLSLTSAAGAMCLSAAAALQATEACPAASSSAKSEKVEGFSEEAIQRAQDEGVDLFALAPKLTHRERAPHLHPAHGQASGLTRSPVDAKRLDGCLASDFFQKPAWNSSMAPQTKAEDNRSLETMARQRRDDTMQGYLREKAESAGGRPAGKTAAVEAARVALLTPRGSSAANQDHMFLGAQTPRAGQDFRGSRKAATAAPLLPRPRSQMGASRPGSRVGTSPLIATQRPGSQM